MMIRQSGYRSLIVLARNAEHMIMRRQTIVADAPIALERHAEKRQDQRHQLNQSAIVSVLGTASETLIDYDDNRLLGEVVYCAKEQAGWLVGIRVEHALLGLSTLASIGAQY